MVLVKEELGNDWLSSDRFRIGASSLLKDIDVEILKAYDEGKDISNVKPVEDSTDKEKIPKGRERKKNKEKGDKEDLKD